MKREIEIQMKRAHLNWFQRLCCGHGTQGMKRTRGREGGRESKKGERKRKRGSERERMRKRGMDGGRDREGEREYDVGTQKVILFKCVTFHSLHKTK